MTKRDYIELNLGAAKERENCADEWCIELEGSTREPIYSALGILADAEVVYWQAKLDELGEG